MIVAVAGETLAVAVAVAVSVAMLPITLARSTRADFVDAEKVPHWARNRTSELIYSLRDRR